MGLSTSRGMPPFMQPTCPAGNKNYVGKSDNVEDLQKFSYNIEDLQKFAYKGTAVKYKPF